MINLDDELAEATDALLNKQAVKLPEGENRELVEVVRQLYQMIDPERPPSAVFQQRMSARLDSEWERSNSEPTLRLLDRPLVRLVALAAAVVLILAAIVVLAVPNSPQQLQGAAIGLDDGIALIVLIGVAAAGAFFYWRSRH